MPAEGPIEPFVGEVGAAWLRQHPDMLAVVVEELEALGYVVTPPEPVLPGEPGGKPAGQP